MKNCSKCVFFEMKKKKDLYMWISNIPNGPSAKFLLENGMSRPNVHFPNNIRDASCNLVTCSVRCILHHI